MQGRQHQAKSSDKLMSISMLIYRRALQNALFPVMVVVVVLWCGGASRNVVEAGCPW